MNLDEARKLRDTIREAGLHCTVPLGPPRSCYYAKIFTNAGELRLYGPADWDRYVRERDAKRIQNMPRPKSPIDAMIDAACGITETNYAGPSHDTK